MRKRKRKRIRKEGNRRWRKELVYTKLL